MKDLRWQIVTVVMALMGFVGSLFAISDKFVKVRELQQYMESVDGRLERIEKRMDLYGFPQAYREDTKTPR